MSQRGEILLVLRDLPFPKSPTLITGEAPYIPERRILFGLMSVELVVDKCYVRNSPPVCIALYRVFRRARADKTDLAISLGRFEFSRNSSEGTVRKSCSIHSKTRCGFSVAEDVFFPPASSQFGIVSIKLRIQGQDAMAGIL